MTLPSQGMPEYRHTVFKRKARTCGNTGFALLFADGTFRTGSRHHRIQTKGQIYAILLYKQSG